MVEDIRHDDGEKFIRPFGCGIFIRDFLAGRAPFGSAAIDPDIGACQEDIFSHYKRGLHGKGGGNGDRN